ncbi:putative ribonuclease H-like domain-containing protein [Tanacetum coccineum]
MRLFFYEQLAILKRDISYKYSEISMLKSELEKLKQEKESNQLKIEKFNNASKSLDKLIGSQITDKSRKGVGFVNFNAIPPPPTRLFLPLNLDLSYSGLEEFQQPEFEGYGPKTSKSVSKDISNEVRESPNALLVEELVLDDKLKKKTAFPTIADYNYHQKEKVVSGNNYTRVNYNYSAKKAHPSAHKNIVPRAVLMKTGLRSLNTAKPMGHPKDHQGIINYRGMFSFGGGAKGGRITSKGTLKTGKLDFEDVYIIKFLLIHLNYPQNAQFFGDESELDLSNIATTYPVPTTPNTKIHKDHSLDHVLGDVQSGVQTKRMIIEKGFISAVHKGKTHENLHTCLFACFLSQEEPKKTLVDLPYGKRAIGTKWVYRNKKDERVARIKAIRLFLAYASFKDFVVCQMDVKSACLYGQIKEVYVCQPLGFEDPEFPNKVYKLLKYSQWRTSKHSEGHRVVEVEKESRRIKIELKG